MADYVDFKTILDSIPKEELYEQVLHQSLFARLRRMPEERIRDQFMVFRPTPKTELLSPEGEVLMRDGEIVDKENPKMYVGLDFGYKKGDSVPLTILKEDD